MSIDVLINELKGLKEGDRGVDRKIARQLGWKRHVENRGTNQNGQPIEKVKWIGAEDGKLPLFTDSLDAAFGLVRIVTGFRLGGVSWGNGEFRAVIGEGLYCTGATPAIALCIAAMTAKRGEDQDEE